MTGAESSGALHRDAVVVDCHNDLILLVAHHREFCRTDYFRDHWIPELRRGGVDVQVLPVFIDDEHRPEGGLRRALELIELAHEEAGRNAAEVTLCMNGAEIDSAVADGKIALLLALEGCEPVGTDVELFTAFFRLGVRMASLTHFGRTGLADGSAEEGAGSRLTRAGIEAIAAMESLGMVVDVSHLSRAGTDHVLELATRPVIASHSSSRALRDHHRNLPDEQLKGIGASGGVVGINLLGAFIDPVAPTIDGAIDHIEHVAETAGIDHVGLGPDFISEYFDTRYPGESLIMEGLDARSVLEGTTGSSRDLPLITEELVRRGFSEGDIRKILGENFLRVFRGIMGVPRPR